MKYRRALLLVDPAAPVRPALALLHRVAPELERLHALVPVAERYAGTAVSLDELRDAATGVAASVVVELAPALGAGALAALCDAERIDLLVFGSRTFQRALLAPVRRTRPSVAVLWTGGREDPGPIEVVGCVAPDRRSRAATDAFLRDHADRSMHVVTLSPKPFGTSMRHWLDESTRERRIDLLVFARLPAAVVLGGLPAVPVLLVPPLAGRRAFGLRAFDVADLVDDGGPILARVGLAGAVGDLASIPDQELAFVSGGRVVARVTTSAGEAELPAGLGLSSLGVYRTGDGAVDPVSAIEQWVAVIHPGQRPLIVFDSELPRDALRRLRAASESSSLAASELLAVRLRPTRSCPAIRERLRGLGLPPLVIDARAVLDEGEALDVSDTLDPVRLARVATRLQSRGFPVVAIVHRGPVAPLARGFSVLGPDLASSTAEQTSVSAISDGNRVELEIDNATARRWLLEAIESSARTLHFQVYMALDDDIGRRVEAALGAAAARGVTVRVLVDSLHGLHGSFGTRNPLLERLAARPGVELRALRPITELPTLRDLKQRDHRKLVIADGRLALLGGRNLSHEYYTPFDEVRLTPESPWREVPWLDAGARIEGPAVAALGASFLEAWTEAGGAPFEVAAGPPAGTSSARVVVHRGLRDASTLETYLELIASARSHIYLVNGFPLALEIQHALVRAIRRGVRARTLLGHLTPTHSGRPFKGPWATARSAATELVHSRMDPVIAEGGETYLFARRDLPGWAPELGIVHPHVHAKVMTADGLRAAVGSANMDITGSYWESELLLVVEDAALMRRFEAQIETLISGSVQVKRDDPTWRQHAERRAWMRHWPGVLSA